jgi:pyruvate kinase
MSHKGLNLPKAVITGAAVTKKDLEFVRFGLKEGIDAFSISFVKEAKDIEQVRRFAHKLKSNIFIVAKIERDVAVKNADEIIQAADAIMVARGDLGVEIPMEQVPMVQKKLIHQANLYSRPVITATQMLESMIDNIRPTRAEVTDVANAILDGTDAVMLSAETAVGSYPVEAVKMMAKIAAVTERQRHAKAAAESLRAHWKKDHENKHDATIKDTISLDVADTVDQLDISQVLAPTDTGDTPRRISRFKPSCWILAFTSFEQTRNCLALSWGVFPFLMEHPASRWDKQLVDFVVREKLATKKDRLLLTEGIPLGKDTGTNSLRIITVS